MKKVKPGRWQVRVFHEGEAADLAILPSGNFLSEWEGRNAYLDIESKTVRLEEYAATQWKRSRDYFPAKAAEIIFYALGETDLWIREESGVASGPVETFSRLLRRAGWETPPETLHANAFLDASGSLRLPMGPLVELAQVLALIDPEAVLLWIDAEEKEGVSRSHRDPGLTPYIAEDRPAWALAREWANAGLSPVRGRNLLRCREDLDVALANLWRTIADENRAFRWEIQRLRFLVDQAIEALDRAGAKQEVAFLEQHLRASPPPTVAEAPIDS